MYGEDDRTVRAGHSVKVGEQFKGGAGIETGGRFIEKDETGHAQ